MTGEKTAAPCSAAGYRQFDFWIGTWVVRDRDGEPAGTNRIEPILGGCALREQWTGASGHEGTSYNAYDDATDTWHQTWVDGSGLLLRLDGGLRDGAMVLEGERRSRDDPHRIVRHRISWSRIDGDPNRVRQHWEHSEDGGATWATLFDGRYERVKP